MDIRREIEFVRDYLDIQKLRFTKRLQYSIEVDPQYESAASPRSRCSRLWKMPSSTASRIRPDRWRYACASPPRRKAGHRDASSPSRTTARDSARAARGPCAAGFPANRRNPPHRHLERPEPAGNDLWRPRAAAGLQPARGWRVHHAAAPLPGGMKHRRRLHGQHKARGSENSTRAWG